jgi:hypothetical protein
MTNPQPAAALASETTYRDLLTKAARSPDLLTDDERARLKPEDRDYIAAQLRRMVAGVDARIAGLDVRPRTVPDRRADDLVRLARKGELRFFSLSDDEYAAIMNTPGLIDRLEAAWS